MQHNLTIEQAREQIRSTFQTQGNISPDQVQVILAAIIDINDRQLITSEIISMQQVHINGLKNMFQSAFSNRMIKFGDKIRIQNVGTGHVLHSHNSVYYSGSKKQQVTCYFIRDENDWFIVLPTNSNQMNGVVSYDTPVRLKHVLTGKLLHSENGFCSPVTKEQEVCCFGEESLGNSSNNSWKLIDSYYPANNSPVLKDALICIVHLGTNKALISNEHTFCIDYGFNHKHWAHQYEVACSANTNLKRDWKIL